MSTLCWNLMKSTHQGYPNIHRSTWRMNSPKSTKRDFGSWKQQPSLSMAALKKHALSRGICVWKQMRTQWSSWRLQQADFGDPPIGTWADWAVSSWPGLFFVGRGGGWPFAKLCRDYNKNPWIPGDIPGSRNEQTRIPMVKS